MFNTYVYIYTLTTYYSGLRNTLSQNVWVCICLCVCVSVCICVHNLTSLPGDLLHSQLSAGRIRRPVGNSLDNSPPSLLAGQRNEALSLTRGRWSLIDNQIFFSHAYYFCSTGEFMKDESINPHGEQAWLKKSWLLIKVF